MKFISLLGIFSLILVAPAYADQTDEIKGGKLFLSAVGEVSGIPDMANISAGVISEASTAKAALASNRKQMNSVFKALNTAGIKDRDIQTTGLNVNPVYASYKQGVRSEQRITGYRVSNQVVAIVRDLDGLGAAVDALVSAGANTIGGISFGLSDTTKAQNKARKIAIAHLLAKAELYATSAKVELGPILELREQAPGRSLRRLTSARVATMSDSAPSPIAAGQVSTRITVSATFAITPMQ